MRRNAAVTPSRKIPAIREVLAVRDKERPGAGPRRRFLPAVWILLSGLVLAVDHIFTPGSTIHFPIAFTIPASLAARFSGPWWGIGLAFALPLVRLYLFAAEHAAGTTAEAAVGALLQIDILLFVVLAAVLERQRRRLLKESESLRSTLCVCTSCRNIRGREGLWMPAMEYVATCSESIFRHGMCPECVKAYLGDILRTDAEARMEGVEPEPRPRPAAGRDRESVGRAGDYAGADLHAFHVPVPWPAAGPASPAGGSGGHAIAAAETSSN